MRIVKKQLTLESRGFRYKVYRHMKFDTKLKGNPFEFQAPKVKLASRLGFICSQMSQLLRLLTQMHNNERRCDK